MAALKPDSLLAALTAMLFSESHTRLGISIPAGVEGARKMARNVCPKAGLLPKIPANTSDRQVSPGGQTELAHSSPIAQLTSRGFGWCITTRAWLVPTKLSASRLLLTRQRNLRKQLQVDHHTQLPLQLKKRRRLPPRQHLGHHRHIFQPQRLRLLVHLHPASDIN